MFSLWMWIHLKSGNPAATDLMSTHIIYRHCKSLIQSQTSNILFWQHIFYCWWWWMFGVVTWLTFSHYCTITELQSKCDNKLVCPCNHPHSGPHCPYQGPRTVCPKNTFSLTNIILLYTYVIYGHTCLFLLSKDLTISNVLVTWM